ncbi:MAG: hypothetical protein V4634_04220 [Pseudomonadota bacterium]
MLMSDTFSNGVQVRTNWASILLRKFSRLLPALAARPGNVPELHTAQELAYLAEAEDHRDLERRLAALSNRHQQALHSLRAWPR